MTITATHPQTHGERRSVLAVLGTDGSSHRWVVNLVTWAAAGLMVASGVVHLHLFSIAYQHVATIGPLFVVQAVVSFVLAVGTAVIRRVWTALIGAGAMIATVAGFLISVNYGLFGFQDSFTANDAVGAFVIEITSAVLLLAAVALSIAGRARRSA